MKAGTLAALLICAEVITTTYGDSFTQDLNALNCIETRENLLGQVETEEIEIIQTYKPIKQVVDIINVFLETELPADVVKLVTEGEPDIECSSILPCYVLCDGQETGKGESETDSTILHIQDALMLKGEARAGDSGSMGCWIRGAVGALTECTDLVKERVYDGFQAPALASTGFQPNKLMIAVRNQEGLAFRDLTERNPPGKSFRCKATEQTVSYLKGQSALETQLRELIRDLNVFPMHEEEGLELTTTSCSDIWGAGRLVLELLGKEHTSQGSSKAAAELCSSYIRFLAEGDFDATISQEKLSLLERTVSTKLRADLLFGDEDDDRVEPWERSLAVLAELYPSTDPPSGSKAQAYLKTSMIGDFLSMVEDNKVELYAQMERAAEDLHEMYLQARSELDEVITTIGSPDDTAGKCQVKKGRIECHRPPYLMREAEDEGEWNLLGRRVRMSYREAVRFKCLPRAGPPLEIFSWNRDVFYTYHGSLYKYGDWSVSMSPSCIENPSECSGMWTALTDLQPSRAPFEHEQAYWLMHEDWLYFTPQVPGLTVQMGEFTDTDAEVGKVYRFNASTSSMSLGGNTLTYDKLFSSIESGGDQSLQEMLLVEPVHEYQHFNAKEIVNKANIPAEEINHLEVFRTLANNPIEMMKASPIIKRLIIGLGSAVVVLILLVVSMIVGKCCKCCNKAGLSDHCVTLTCHRGGIIGNNEERKATRAARAEPERLNTIAEGVEGEPASAVDRAVVQRTVEIDWPVPRTLNLQSHTTGGRRSRRRNESLIRDF